jgi:hypothetical protein
MSAQSAETLRMWYQTKMARQDAKGRSFNFTVYGFINRCHEQLLKKIIM